MELLAIPLSNLNTIAKWLVISPALSRRERGTKSRFASSTLNTGWGGRDRTYECRNQNPVPYHLATPQETFMLRQNPATDDVASRAPRCHACPEATGLLLPVLAP